MRSLSCAFALVLATSGCFIVGCVNPAEDSTTTDSSELRALGSSEILGDIAFGTDTTAVHSGSPKYRAFGFDASAGDTVDIWVRASGHDAMAWLLRSDFATVTSNDDADYNADDDTSTTNDAHIVKRISAAGHYYIAFREKTAAPATFTVRVDRSGNNPPPPPPPPPVGENPWACSGAPLNRAALTQRFTPGTDSLSFLGAGVRYEQRVRTCNNQTGCAGWGSVQSVGGNDGALKTLSIGVNSNGNVMLSIASASDSSESYDVSSGTFTSNDHHAPNHSEAEVAGALTEGCIGWRIKTKQNGNVLGTWTETEYGVRTSFPGAVSQPPSTFVNDWTCSGTALTNDAILRRIPAGGDSLDVLAGRSARYEERHRTCNSTTGCTSWTAAASVAGNDGALKSITVQTQAAGGLNLSIASQSDSSESFSLSGGSFSTSDFHTPNHSEVPATGSITEGCMAWSFATKQSANGNGTWTEMTYGVKTTFPAAIR